MCFLALKTTTNRSNFPRFRVVSCIKKIGGDSITKEELVECFEFLEKHNIQPHISKVFELQQANEAQNLLTSESSSVTGRIVLKMPPTDLEEGIEDPFLQFES